MGFWETLTEIGKKVPEIANSLKELSKDEHFTDHLGKAGTIGSLCLIGLDIYSKIKNDLKTPEQRVFGSLLKIVFESTKESLPESDKIELKEIKTEDLINELFDIFIQTADEWDFDLPSHPVIDRYKKHILYIVKTNHYNIDLTRFFIEFRIRIEDKIIADENIKAIADENIKPLYREAVLRKLCNDLKEYLEYLKKLKDEVNPVDNRSFIHYYIENKAVLVAKYKWHEENKNIASDPQWTLEDFFKSKDWFIVIGAPFGIGKTSLVKHIAIDYASKHLEEPFGVHNYIPVFVSLKDKLKNVFYRNDFDYVLDSIIAPEIGKRRKILLICDGLDEYGDNIDGLLTNLEKRHRELTNMKVIITTRLEAGLPQTLGLKEYVRLLPFDKDQVNDFFSTSKYNIPNIYYETLEKYGLQEEEIGKPLFCWMFAVIHPQLGTIFEGVEDGDIKRSLIYQEFIHSTIRGKHRQSGIDHYNYTEYDIDKEKKIFRKIAALKMIYGNSLTENIVIRELAKFEDKLIPENEEIKTLLAPIISSYFYLEGPASDPKLDFIHETFKEYLLAEYYIEVLLMDKPRPYRLNIGIPSYDAVLFFLGLLKMFNEPSLIQRTEKFIKSLTPSGKRMEADYAKDLMIENAKYSIKDPQIVFQTEREIKELWYTFPLQFSQYPGLWIHLWICMYVTNTLAQEVRKDKEKMIEQKMLSWLGSESRIDDQGIWTLISMTSRSIPNYLKKFIGSDLSFAELPSSHLHNANLSHADLSYANLSFANLTYANLTYANLTYADLSHADLSHADLSHADLSYANLTHVHLSENNLSDAILSHADLSAVDLTHANLSRANLSDAILSHATFFKANLSGANLSHASLSHTHMIQPCLSEATLSHAHLLHTNISHINLSGANLSGAIFFEANLSGANLSGANLSGAIFCHVSLSLVNISEANLSSSTIIGCEEYDNLICENALFDDVIMDSSGLSNYFQNNKVKNVPPAINDKMQLRERLKETGVKKELIELMLRYSS